MVKTVGAAAAADKWKKAIPRVAGSYEEGVRRTTGWKEAAIAGEDNYKTALTEAMNQGRRAAGINAINESKWKDNAASKGRDRIAGGMNASASEYTGKIAKVISVIEGTTLPARTTDAASNVQNRVVPLAVNLQEARRRGELR